jgi:hypothetical protein
MANNSVVREFGKRGRGTKRPLRLDYSITNGTIPDISRKGTASSSLFTAGPMGDNRHNTIRYFAQDLYIISEKRDSSVPQFLHFKEDNEIKHPNLRPSTQNRRISVIFGRNAY